MPLSKYTTTIKEVQQYKDHVDKDNKNIVHTGIVRLLSTGI